MHYEGSNLVSLRDITEGLNASFVYYPESGTIGFTKDKHKVTLTLGSKKRRFIMEIATQLSVAPKAINGITYIPVQSIKGLGATIKFDSSNNTLDIQI
ncbi:hypothetical protein D3C74_145210 [compost metagenome]